MADYSTLKAAIQAVIRTNGNEEITGATLQQSLLTMIDSLGAGYQFMGVASTSTNPGTPDQNGFYLAFDAGTYSNFGGTSLDNGQVGVFSYNGSWTYTVKTIAQDVSWGNIGGTLSDQTDLQNALDEIASAAENTVKYTSQSLTDAQKTQARTNLGAASEADLSQLEAKVADLDYENKYEITPTQTYTGKYLEDDGTMPDSSTLGAEVKEYEYAGGKVLASGFSPSGSKTAIQYWAGANYLGSEKFGETVGFTEEELTIPDGTTKIYVAGNNRNNVPNYPHAYSYHFTVDDSLSSISKHPVQNRVVKEAIEDIDYNVEKQLVPVASYPAKALKNDGTMFDSTVNGAVVNEYTYTGGKVLASGFSPSGSNVPIQYFNGSTFLGYQKFGETVGFTKQALAIPAGTTKIFVAGNLRNNVSNLPYAYLLNLAVDGILDTNSESPVQNKVFAGKVMYKNEGKTIGVFGGSHSVREESQTAKDLWKQKLNVTITDYGVSGAGFSSLQGTSIQTQVDGAASKDIYILWGSTNDFRNSREVGTWQDYTADDNYDSDKLVTMCGGINYCIKKLMTTNPLAQIYFFLPMRFYSADSGHNPFSTVTNSQGKTFWDYIVAMKQCCEHYGIPVLDQFNYHGVNDFNYTNYFKSDNLHLNEAGYALIGWVQAEFLANGLA